MGSTDHNLISSISACNVDLDKKMLSKSNGALVRFD